MTTPIATPMTSILERQRAALFGRGPEAVERLAWDRELIRAHQQVLLRRLLAHAVERSPFHARRLADIDVPTFTLDDLETLPTLTKAEMMREFDDVVTDRRIDRQAVEDHLAATTTEVRYLLDEYVVMASGGSSGERGVFVYDLDAATEFALALVRPTLARLAAFGVTPENPISGALVAAEAALHGTAFVAAVAGEGGPVRLTSVPATLPLGQITSRLEELQPMLVVGYPTVLARLAVEKAAGRLAITPLAISATSEPLSPEARRSIEAAFGVPISNTFGSTEGLIGVGPPGQEAICFAEDSCIVELVDEQHQPITPGTPSAKVLVTNLANLAQPLIRYELTDRFTEVTGPWPDGHLRAIVDGRNDDVLSFGDLDIHPLTIRSILVKAAGVTEYQARQRANGIDVLAVAPEGLDVDALASELRHALELLGLRDAFVGVEVVERITRDPLTGKARRFVPMR